MENVMQKYFTAILASFLFISVNVIAAPADASTCEAKAVSKEGKPLVGAAKASSIKKCEAEAKGTAVADSGCAAKAVSSKGKPLAGAAKTSFMKKCEADAKTGK
jgi:hypothetical protein